MAPVLSTLPMAMTVLSRLTVWGNHCCEQLKWGPWNMSHSRHGQSGLWSASEPLWASDTHLCIHPAEVQADDRWSPAMDSNEHHTAPMPGSTCSLWHVFLLPLRPVKVRKQRFPNSIFCKYHTSKIVLLGCRSSSSQWWQRMTRHTVHSVATVRSMATVGNLQQAGNGGSYVFLGNLGFGFSLWAVTWPSFYTHVPWDSAFAPWSTQKTESQSRQMKLSGRWEASPTRGDQRDPERDCPVICLNCALKKTTPSGCLFEGWDFPRK